MASIKNIDGLTVDQMNYELNNGAKFVVFQYCISIVVMSFKQSGSIYFIRAGESTLKYHIGNTILTFLLGWWGFPWGLIYTPSVIWSNFTGGKDVTFDVLNAMNSTTSESQFN